MAKNLKELLKIRKIDRLWQEDENGDYMPIGDLPTQAIWDADTNDDIMPSNPPMLLQDEEWELDLNGDLQPKY